MSTEELIGKVRSQGIAALAQLDRKKLTKAQLAAILEALSTTPESETEIERPPLDFGHDFGETAFSVVESEGSLSINITLPSTESLRQSLVSVRSRLADYKVNLDADRHVRARHDAKMAELEAELQVSLEAIGDLPQEVAKSLKDALQNETDRKRKALEAELENEVARLESERRAMERLTPLLDALRPSFRARTRERPGLRPGRFRIRGLGDLDNSVLTVRDDGTFVVTRDDGRVLFDYSKVAPHVDGRVVVRYRGLSGIVKILHNRNASDLTERIKNGTLTGSYSWRQNLTPM